MIRARAEAERNTNSAADVKNKSDADCRRQKLPVAVCILLWQRENRKEGDRVVELDQFKYTLGTYEKPLLEVRDSL